MEDKTQRPQRPTAMDFSRDILDIKVAVQRIESSMVTRAEIDADMARRITQDVYLADKQGILDRLVRIETNPQKLIAWISAGIGCFGILIAGASLVFTFVIYFITHK